MFDEPSLGLAPNIVERTFEIIQDIRAAGVTVLMVEQNVRTALKYADRALVLEMGRVALDRPANALLGDPDLNRLFLGGHVERPRARATTTVSPASET
jgi:branched-chain amino acid transport system ATP-binding protein